MGKEISQRNHKKLVEQRRAATGAEPNRVATHPLRAIRITDAKKRLDAWRLLTIEQQLDAIKHRPGKSLRQTERLIKLKNAGFRYIPEPGTKVEQAKVIEAKPIEKKEKAPPKTDIKAIKALKKKQGKAS